MTDSAEAYYAHERIDVAERRRAQLAIIVFGLAFVGICAGYVVLAAGEILG